jgi:aquaporin Z
MASDLRKRESHSCHWFALNRIFSRPRAAWRLLAEAVGTFFLVSAAAGGEVVAVASKGQLGTAAKVAAPGIVVMAFIYALGDVSGAHFNPVVTLAFAVRGVFRWSCVPAYWIVQLAAAAVAALGLRALFGDVAHLGAHKPHVTEMKVVSVDTVLTLLLVLVILNTATRATRCRTECRHRGRCHHRLVRLHRRTHIWRAMNPARALGAEPIAAHWTAEGDAEPDRPAARNDHDEQGARHAQTERSTNG